MIRIVTIICLIITISHDNLYAQTSSFLDISKQAGVNISGQCYGVAFGDYDNDGDDDLYVSRQGEPNKLYKNLGNNTFEDVSLFSNTDYNGPTRASTWADFDNDGNLDLFLANWGAPCIYYRNNGDGTFINETYNARINATGKPNSVNTADVNNDGYLDIYIAYLSQENVLYLNNGNGTFTDFTKESGATDPSISMAALFFDFDNDGDQDLYLTHDANVPYILYENDGTGRFKNISEKAGVNYAGQGMGVDFGDCNNDGFMDLYITNLYENTLFINNGDGSFRNVSKTAGVDDRGMGWGTIWLDYNNDGFKDLYVVNDTKFAPSSYTNKLYKNNGNETFTEVSTNTVLTSPFEGYGGASSDINGDGNIDIFVANRGIEGSQLFLNNEKNNGHWLEIKCIGTKSNKDAIGTRLQLICGDNVFSDQISSNSGYASQNSLTQHFGIGIHDKIDELTVIWPSGRKETFKDLAADQKIIIKEGLSIDTKWAGPVKESLFNNSKIVYQGKNPYGMQFELSESENIVFEIFTLEGKLIHSSEFKGLSSGIKCLEIPAGVQEFPGLYLAKASSGENNITQKFIIY